MESKEYDGQELLEMKNSVIGNALEQIKCDQIDIQWLHDDIRRSLMLFAGFEKDVDILSKISELLIPLDQNPDNESYHALAQRCCLACFAIKMSFDHLKISNDIQNVLSKIEDIDKSSKMEIKDNS